MNYFNLTIARKFSNTSFFFSLLFSLFLIFPSKGQPASYTLQSGDLTINDGIITACSYNFANKRIVIPTSIDGKDIARIASKAYNEKGVFEDSGLISVSFPTDSKVTSIGDRAFANNALTSVEFLNGMTSIGDNAFWKNALTSIDLPSSLTSIGREAFFSNLLTSVTLRDNSHLEYIRLDAFADNPNLDPIKFPSHARNDFEGYRDGNGNHYNPDDTFFDFSLAYFASIPYELTANELTVDVNGIITDCNCDNLSSRTIIIPKSIAGNEIKGIAGRDSPSVFESKGLISVSFAIDSKLTLIGEKAFHNNALAFVELPDGLATIGESVFQSNNLTSVDFPASLTAIGDKAFLFNDLASVGLPDGLTTIGESVFQSNNLTSVDFPASLIIIKDWAFADNRLTSVSFLKNSDIQTIEERAFAFNNFDNNQTLASITLPLKQEEGRRYYWTQNLSKAVIDPVITDFIASYHRRWIEQIKLTLKIGILENETFTEGDFGAVEGLQSGDNWINKGEAFDLVATANAGYRFVEWEIDDMDMKEPTNLYNLSATQTDSDVNVTAYFVEQVTLTVSIDGNMGGNISPRTGTFTVDKDNSAPTQQLTATADDSYRFDKWIINGQTIATPTTTVDMDVSKSATAYFVEQVTLTVSVYDDIGGSVSPPDGVFTVDKDNPALTQQLVATASDSYRFDKWIINGQTVVDSTTTITMDGNKSATAYFVEQVTLTVSIDGNMGGNISPREGIFTVDKVNPASTQQLVATASEGYRFDKWIINGQTVVDSTTTIIMDGNKLAIAYFVEQVEQVTLTVSINGNMGGNISPRTGTFTVDKDNPAPTQQLVATAGDSYRFDKWIIDREIIRDLTTTVTLDVDKKAVAYFVEQVTLTVSIDGNMGGNILPREGTFTVDKDNPAPTQQLVATADDSYRFDKWIINELTVVDSTTTITMDGNKSATAYFVEVESSISKPPNHPKPLVPFYPNPAFKVLTVAIAEVGDRIELLSELGTSVHSSERTVGSLHQIDVEALPSGVYLLQITDSQSETLSYKVVKISTK